MQEWFEQLGLPPDNLAFVEIEGDHMAPAIPAGAFVLVDEAQRDPFSPTATGAVFVVQHEGRCGAHRVSTADNGLIVFTHLSPNHPAIICNRSDLTVSHRIIGQIVCTSSTTIK